MPGYVRPKIVGKKSPFYSPPGPYSLTFGTPTAEAADARTVSIQLKDANGKDLAVRAAIRFYVASDATGDTIASATGLTTAAGTDGLYLAGAASNQFIMVSEADGDIDIVITRTGGATIYLVAVMEDGRIVPSAGIVYAP